MLMSRSSTNPYCALVTLGRSPMIISDQRSAARAAARQASLAGARAAQLDPGAAAAAILHQRGHNITNCTAGVSRTIELADGTIVKPFQAIGYTRLFGMGATTIAVPAATAEAFAAIYDVTDHAEGDNPYYA